MIIEYHRPTNLTEALALLAREEPRTAPLAGGTVMNQPSPEPVAVVDLQALRLDGAERKENQVLLGAMLTLQALLKVDGLPAALQAAVHHETTYNLRNIATVAGSLVAADGRSSFATAFLAMDAQLIFMPGNQMVRLGDFLLQRNMFLAGKLITRVVLPANVRLAYECVARTPADLPLVSVAIAQWSSGRTRLALGGYGPCPILGLDGPDPGGAELAAAIAYAHASDEWANAAYRADVAAVLAKRCIAQLLA